MKLKWIIVGMLFCISPLYAATPLLSLIPTVKAPTTIYPGNTAIAYYAVTNNAPFTLQNIGVHNLPNGISANFDSAGLSPEGLTTCRSSFNLAPGALLTKTQHHCGPAYRHRARRS